MVCLFFGLLLALVCGCGAEVPVGEPVDFSVSFPRKAAEMELCSSGAMPETEADPSAEEPAAEAEEGEIGSVTFGVIYDASPNDSLGGMIARAGVTVIDFTAPWCGPCKNLFPEVEKMAAEFEDVCFWTVDIDKCPSICQEAGGIVSVPCVKVYSGVNEVGQVTGNYPARLRGLLLSVLRERRE